MKISNLSSNRASRKTEPATTENRALQVRRAIMTVINGGTVNFRASQSEYVALHDAATSFIRARRLVGDVERTPDGFRITVRPGEMPDMMAKFRALQLGESVDIDLPRHNFPTIRNIAYRVNMLGEIKLSCKIDEKGMRVTRVPINDIEALEYKPTMMKTRDQQSKYQFERLLHGEDAYEIDVTPRELDCVRNLACKFGRRNDMRVSVRQLSDGSIRVIALERLKTASGSI